MKQISLLLLSFFLCTMLKVETTMASSSYVGGSGTSDDPWQIAGLAQLEYLRENSSDWSKHFILINDIDATNTKNYSDGKGWSRIGSSTTKSFTGSFDGNGHVIDGLYINRKGEYNHGLFGYISGATVKNLGLTNCSMAFGSSSAALIADADNGSDIRNCYVTGTIDGTGYNLHGALVGYLYDSEVDQCYTNCSITGDMNTGGLIGNIDGASTVTNCFVLGSTSGGKYRGGIAGQLKSGTVENCYVAGVVNKNSTYIGTIVGYRSGGDIYYCYYDETVNPNLRPVNNTVYTFIEPLSTSDFADASNFYGWDFGSTWRMIALASVDNLKRPYLQYAYDHVISFELGANGSSITGAEMQGVADGADALAVKAIGADGYIFKEWQNSSGNSISIDNPLTITNVTQDSTLYAIFQPGYKVEFSTDGNGTIDGFTYQEILSGNSSSEVEAFANEHFLFDEWRNASGDSITNINPLKVNNVTQDSTMIAVFETVKHNISFSADINGAISSGEAIQSVAYGSDAYAVAVVANTGYHFEEWRNVDGDSITSDNPLIITNVTQDSTLVAVFEIDTFNIEFSVGANGVISSGEANQKVTYGSNASKITVIANTGYHFDEWRNAAGDSITNDNPLIVTNVSQDSSLIAVFEKNTYTVTFSSDENGTVSGETTQTIAYNSNATTVTANASTGGYSFVEWQDESGNTVSTNNPLTLTNVIQDSVLKAIFTERYAGGFGSSDNPYQIATLEQLKALSESVGDWSKSFMLTSDIDASDTRNWNITGTDTLGFSPIGDWDRGDRQKVTFTGSFDGNNHIISNLYIKRAERFLGLFGCIEKDVVIKNTGLTNISITSNTNETAYAGAIVGYADGRYGEMKISNCFAAGGSIIAANKYVGGLIGDMNRIDLTNCFSNVNVEGNEVVGGLIGYAGYTPSSNIKNCYAAGKVCGDSHVGGFIGDNTSATAITITNCYYDSISTEQVKGTGSIQNNNLTALTTAQFADTSIFSDWDFTSTWKIDSYSVIDSVKRPYLKGMLNYMVNFIVDQNGSITGEISQSVRCDSNATAVTAVPNTGYHFVKWQDVNGTTISTDNPLTLTNVTHDSTVKAVFEITQGNQYTITFTTDGNGTVSGNTTQTVDAGADASAVTAVPNTGYHFVKWQDGNGTTISTDNPLTLTNVTQDSTIKAVFEINQGNQYTVTFTTDGNGTVSGNTTQTVDAGADASAVTAVPNTGYHFVKWMDNNGTTISADNPFTLTKVTRDSIITAVFERTTGVESLSTISNLDIYPNPTTGQVNIMIKNNQNGELTIYSITGEMVYSNPSFNGGSVDLSGLNKGVYVVNVKVVDKISMLKLIVQ